MVYLYIALVVVLVGIGAFFTFSRRRTKEEPFEMPALNNNFRNRAALIPPFVRWVEQTDATGAGAWLGGLAQKEREKFVKQVEQFCKKSGFQLAWIVDQQIEDEALRTHAEQSVLHFVQAYQGRDKIQDDLQIYIALIDLLKNGKRRSHQPKLQAIYLRLARQNVIPNANVDLLFDQDRRRWEYAAKAIAIASRSHRDAVSEAIRIHILGEDEPTPQPNVAAAPLTAAMA